jgi:hypothetical protein
VEGNGTERLDGSREIGRLMSHGGVRSAGDAMRERANFEAASEQIRRQLRKLEFLRFSPAGPFMRRWEVSCSGAMAHGTTTCLRTSARLRMRARVGVCACARPCRNAARRAQVLLSICAMYTLVGTPFEVGFMQPSLAESDATVDRVGVEWA